jgi:hypothetical protein
MALQAFHANDATQLSPLSPATSCRALDTWHRVENLWLRLGRLLPLALHADREQRHLHWIGLRRLTHTGHLVLRFHAMNLQTYGWREQADRRTLVTLVDWEGDDLLLALMPSRTLRRWAEGDCVDQLLDAFLAGQAVAGAGSCYSRALSTSAANGRPSASATRCMDISPTFCSPRSMLDMYERSMPARCASSSCDRPASARACLMAVPNATSTGSRAWLGEARGMPNGHNLTPIAPRTIIYTNQGQGAY